MSEVSVRLGIRERKRQNLLSFLGEPRTTTEIARHLGIQSEKVRDRLSGRWAARMFTRVGPTVFVVSSHPIALAQHESWKRAAPIRDAILDFLTEPRSVAEIADRIKRPIPTVTGHLQAACKLGLVKRLERAIYVHARYNGSFERTKQPPGRSASECDLRRKLRNLLFDRHSENDLCGLTGASLPEVQGELQRMWRNGLLSSDDASHYQLRPHAQRRYERVRRAV